MKLVHVEHEDIFLRFGDGVMSVDCIHASKAIGEIWLNSYPTFDLRGNEPNQLPPVDGDHASTRVWRGAAFAALTSMFCPVRERLINWDLLQCFIFNTFSIHCEADRSCSYTFKKCYMRALICSCSERYVHYSGRVKTHEQPTSSRHGSVNFPCI